MPTVIRNDPYPGHNFQVIVTGVSDDGSAVSGAFSEISGLELEIKAIEYRNGNEPNTVRKITGPDDAHQPHVQARVDRPRRVLELDQEGPRRTGAARRGLDHPPGREQGRSDALELLARLAVQVHGPDLQRGEQRDRDGVRGDLRRRALPGRVTCPSRPCPATASSPRRSLLVRKGCATTSRASSDRPCAARSACPSECRDARRSSRPSVAGNRAPCHVPSRRTSRTVVRSRGSFERGVRALPATQERPARSRGPGERPGAARTARERAAVHRDEPRGVGQRHQGAAHLPRIRVRR